MAGRKEEAPKGDSQVEDQEKSEGSFGISGGNVVADKAAEGDPDAGTAPVESEAEKLAAKAAEAQRDADAAEAQARQVQVDAAVEAAKDARAESVETDDQGRVIGVDGKNPVSNINPDPRTIRGAEGVIVTDQVVTEYQNAPSNDDE
jgi:hypothetical protein